MYPFKIKDFNLLVSSYLSIFYLSIHLSIYLSIYLCLGGPAGIENIPWGQGL